jgi:hypothetical protein
MSRREITKAWRLRDSIDESEGMTCYERHHLSMRSMADRYGYPLERIVAAFVALSPNNDYVGNMRSLVSAVIGHKIGLEVHEVSVTTYDKNKEMAFRYLDGERFLTPDRGPKITNFYVNILRPEDKRAVTIDGHMIGLWHGKRVPMKGATVIMSKDRKQYNIIAADFRQAARLREVLPQQLQGILWFTWKRVHGVKAVDQLSLFASPGNQWGIFEDASTVKPFNPKLYSPAGQILHDRYWKVACEGHHNFVVMERRQYE